MKIEDLVTQYLTFWNNVDIDGLMSMYAEDMTYSDMPSGEVIPFENLKDHLSKTFAFDTKQSLTLNEAVYPDDSSAFIYWTQSIQAGARGKSAQINGVELLVFRNEKIVSIHEFYDYHGEELEAAVAPKDATADQMAKLGLNKDMTQTIGDQIRYFFERDKPFLDPDLNLTSVSNRIGYSRNQVSFVLNNVLNQTFYDLVNQHRIEHVIQQMSSSTTRRSILEMAINAGFNSMSGFYNAFKRKTGLSPVQFQKTKLTNPN